MGCLTTYEDVDVPEVINDVPDEAVDSLPLAEVCDVGPRHLVLLLRLPHQAHGLLVGLGGDVDAGKQAAPASKPQRQEATQASASARQLHKTAGCHVVTLTTLQGTLKSLRVPPNVVEVEGGGAPSAVLRVLTSTTLP